METHPHSVIALVLEELRDRFGVQIHSFAGVVVEVIDLRGIRPTTEEDRGSRRPALCELDVRVGEGRRLFDEFVQVGRHHEIVGTVLRLHAWDHRPEIVVRNEEDVHFSPNYGG